MTLGYAQVLVSAGADRLAQDDSGETPLALARRLGLHDVVAVLQQQARKPASAAGRRAIHGPLTADGHVGSNPCCQQRTCAAAKHTSAPGAG